MFLSRILNGLYHLTSFNQDERHTAKILEPDHDAFLSARVNRYALLFLLVISGHRLPQRLILSPLPPSPRREYLYISRGKKSRGKQHTSDGSTP